MKTTHLWLEELCPHGRPALESAEILQGLGHELVRVEPLPGGDALIELEITANRPDCLSVLGLAHELSAATGIPVRPAAQGPGVRRSLASPELRVLEPSLCPRYTARLIQGVHVGPSPPWLAARLEAIGLKPISNVVDITNYVLFESGQPLHAFDADRLQGGRVHVRRAGDGEKLTTLDGVERALSPEMLVIADLQGPVALAGVMGGAGSAITAATRSVLLEAAVFDPRLIRRTAKALGLASDSSYRFERGVDPQGVERASDRAAALIQQIAGGEAGPLQGILSQVPPAPPAFLLRAGRLESVLGIRIPAADVSRILSGLGCDLQPEGKEGWRVTPPSRRARDLRSEAEAAEEVARVFGYDRIPARISLPARPGWRDRGRELAAGLSERIRGAGFSEAVTTSFCDAPASRVQAFGAARLGPGLPLRNPMSREQTHLRGSLLPGLLATLAHNQDVGEPGGRFFELGRVYGMPNGTQEDGAMEAWCLALAGEGDLRMFQGTLLSTFRGLGIALNTQPGNGGEGFHSGRCILLRDGAAPIGAVGLASPALVKAYDLRKAPVLAEVALQSLLDRATERAPRFQPLPRFPAVDRDLAVSVDEAVTWAEIEGVALSVPCGFREGLAFFDLYRGKQIGQGKKSVAFSIRFRHPERTLTGEEVEETMVRTISALAQACGAEVRH